MVLALDEMASNALRHGGGRVRAAVGQTEDAYLIEVTDQAVASPPAPAVGRDPSEGGLGLYLIAEMAIRARLVRARGREARLGSVAPYHTAVRLHAPPDTTTVRLPPRT